MSVVALARILPTAPDAHLSQRPFLRSHALSRSDFVRSSLIGAAWQDWCEEESAPEDMGALEFYSNLLFDRAVRRLLANARPRTTATIVPAEYVLAATQEIGQDRANDLSHLGIFRERPDADPLIRTLATNQRIFHEHALVLACAYAFAHGIDHVMWQKNLRYAWA